MCAETLSSESDDRDARCESIESALCGIAWIVAVALPVFGAVWPKGFVSFVTVPLGGANAWVLIAVSFVLGVWAHYILLPLWSSKLREHLTNEWNVYNASGGIHLALSVLLLGGTMPLAYLTLANTLRSAEDAPRFTDGLVAALPVALFLTLFLYSLYMLWLRFRFKHDEDEFLRRLDRHDEFDPDAFQAMRDKFLALAPSVEQSVRAAKQRALARSLRRNDRDPRGYVEGPAQASSLASLERQRVHQQTEHEVETVAPLKHSLEADEIGLEIEKVVDASNKLREEPAPPPPVPEKQTNVERGRKREMRTYDEVKEDRRKFKQEILEEAAVKTVEELKGEHRRRWEAAEEFYKRHLQENL